MRRRSATRDVVLAGLPPSATAIREAGARLSWGDWGTAGFARGFFTPRTLAVILAVCLIPALAGEAVAQFNSGAEREGVFATLLKWLPLILFGTLDIEAGGLLGFRFTGQLGGFALNILVSFLVMAIGTVTGVLLGIAQVSKSALSRTPAWAVTQFFRNSPWLVLLFFTVLLLPFQFEVAGVTIPFPDWIKATIGLALPIMANISEITRGAIQSIPTGQWESAESLAFSRAQTFRLIILPQCVKRMTPPWMNWYAILTMATSLISIVGVNDAMTLTQNALAAEGRGDLLLPMYGMLLLLFFAYCYPIARWTQTLERRFAVVS
jgi:polar amino acid transport system permease protein